MSANATAPETLANGPDTLSWILTIRSARSATLLSQAPQELVGVGAHARGEVPGLSLGLAPAGAGGPARGWAVRQQGEDLVNAGMVSGPDGPGTAGGDMATAGTGGGLSSDLGVHEDAGHLGSEG